MTSHKTNRTNDLPTPPAILRIALGALAVFVALTTLPWAYFAANGTFGGFEWGMFGYELVTLLGAFYAFLLSRGRYRNGWAIAVTSIAGAWLVALVFGFFVAFVKAKRADFPELATLTTITLYGRAAAVILAALIASFAVFVRSRKSFVYAAWSLFWASPLIAAAALVQLNTAPGRWISSLFSETPPSSSGGASAVALMGVGLIAIALVSVSGHLLIRAFELGAIDRETPSAPPKDA